MDLSIGWPSQQIDPHANVANREFNWFKDGRGMMWPGTTHYLYVLSAFLYCPGVYFGIRFMKNREAFDLKWPLLTWNIFLSAASGVGAYYVLGFLINYLFFSSGPKSLVEKMCDHSAVYSSSAAWYVAVFNATKVLEWVDTVFLILRKRKVIFLHWFHHILTMLYCWHATHFSYRADASGFSFAGMNLFVHTIMYGYYALKSLKINVPFSTLITFGQTLQMFVGILVIIITPKCNDSWSKNWHGNLFALLMYTIYLILFAKLLLNRLMGSSKKNKNKKNKQI